MSMQFRCSGCRAQFSIRQAPTPGKTLHCPKCQAALAPVDEPAAPSAAPSASSRTGWVTVRVETVAPSQAPSAGPPPLPDPPPYDPDTAALGGPLPSSPSVTEAPTTPSMAALPPPVPPQIPAGAFSPGVIPPGATVSASRDPAVQGTLGHYRLLKVLGQGGMGRVYLAEDPKLKRRIAIKVMKPEAAANPTARKRFVREAQAAARVKHDNIVIIHQVGEDGNTPYLAMELLDGICLDRRLASGDPPSLAEALRIGREVAEGLAAAHARGLIHRDIKPANIFLERIDKGRGREDSGDSSDSSDADSASSDGPGFRVKLLDFGLARPAQSKPGRDEITQQGAIVGTAGYMAPEQADGRSVDPRSDLFSLGCVLYRLTAGRPPFKGKDFLSTLVMTASEAPARPAALNPEVPRAVSDLIMQLLAKDPAKRPQSAAKVAARLKALASDLREPSREPDLWPAVWIAGGVVAFAILLVVALVLLWPRPDVPVVVDVQPPNPPDVKVIAKVADKLVDKAADKIADKVDPKVVPKDADPARDREVALWVIQTGGHVAIVPDPARKSFPTAGLKLIRLPPDNLAAYLMFKENELPAEPFYLAMVMVNKMKTVRDDDLPRFAGLTELRSLSLTGQSITDEGLDHLDRLQRIQFINVTGPRVSVDGTRKLQDRLGCRVQPPLGKPVADPGGINRKVTQWVLSIGGTVELAVNSGTGFPVQARNDLPKSPFVLRGVFITHSPPELTDESLKILKQLNDLRRVNFAGPGIGDETLKLLSSIDTLEMLYLSETNVTDRGFEHIRALKKLTSLTIQGRNGAITDAAMIPIGDLGDLTQLTFLRSSRDGAVPAITNAGLKHIARLKKLGYLGLGGTAVTDAGLAELKDMPLLTLMLEDTAVTDAGVKTLAGMDQLGGLYLHGTKVTDRCFESLATMKNLRFVNLGNTAVTDAGLDGFTPLVLTTLDLVNTRTTAAGRERFRKRCPGIIVNPP